MQSFFMQATRTLIRLRGRVDSGFRLRVSEGSFFLLRLTWLNNVISDKLRGISLASDTLGSICLGYCHLFWTFCCKKTVHYENTPIQIYWKFHHKKLKVFRKNSDIFHNSTQNIVCGYSLEPPCRCGSNEYLHSIVLNRNTKNNVYACKPQFY